MTTSTRGKYMNQNQQDFEQGLDSPCHNLFTEMIPEFQEGYLSYVFQTEKKDIQKRRIKNINKSFHRLLKEPSFYLMPLSQDSAQQIANDWHYQPPFDFYDMTADCEDYEEILSADKRGHHYFQVLRNGVLFGFAAFFKRHDQLEIALGMKPDFVGKGYGRAFFQAIEDYAKLQFAAKCHVLKVADFNKRAKHLYCQMGYKGVTVYNQKTNGSAYPFVRMEKWFSEKE